MAKLQKTIFILFAILFFFVPLILWPYTSEVFEFNKMVLVYLLTILIVSAWLARTVLAQKIIFRRTLLDIPLLAFLGSQIISTILSIDPQTSIFGYYSRFNGGLLSTICYSLLYWAFVSNFDRKDVKKLIVYSLLPSALLVSIYGVLEHFGIDKDVWVQDVQSRVFSTLGQPNWLSAWLIALIPITWALGLNEKFNIKSKIFWVTFSLSTLFFITLLFTKSRSGLLAFGLTYVIFWSMTIWKFRKESLKPFIIISSSLLIISLIIGTQYTPSVNNLINKSTNSANGNGKQIVNTPQGPALEVGGTESGTIRRIVWKGALDVWKNYPITGSGVETFAYSYYKARPKEHNLVSEWDFIYNKAHNEFLNIAATSGSLGLLSYLALIGFSIYIIFKNANSKLESRNSKQIQNSNFENSSLFRISDFDIRILSIALLAGYISLLVTNFFGFSVVPTQLQFFLFPAIAVTLIEQTTKDKEHGQTLNALQKVSFIFVLCTMSYVLFAISKYWYADYLYSTGKNYNTTSRYETAIKYLTEAISLKPNQPLYHNDLATAYVPLAIGYNQKKDAENSKKYTDLAISESKKAIELSPHNINYQRTIFGIYIRLSLIDPNYLVAAGHALTDAIKLAPTDAKLYYNLALVYARTGDTEMALTTLQKTIELKSNYKEARLAYAILLNEKKETAKAKEQLEYILTKIDPNDALTKQTLESLK